MAFTMFPTAIGQRTFANLRFVGASDSTTIPGNRYVLCRYEIGADGRLDLWTVSDHSAADAVAKGLAGRRPDDSTQGSMLITAEPEVLRGYLRQHADRLFDNHIGPFKRLP